MMKYKITVEEITGENTLVFDTESHEDMLAIVEKLQQHPDFKDDAAAFGVGLKLFSSVMMKQKSNPIFKDLMPHFKDFMHGLKGVEKNR